jgi:carotenoid cleavage dioxygenase-like enzyme
MSIDIVNTLASDLEPGDHPYLQGAWTPLLEEVNATDLKVLEGVIPLDIDGVYLRNTENPVLQAKGKYHPFDGDGMLHMAAFKNGQVSYRNRFIKTKGLQAAGRNLTSPGLAKAMPAVAHQDFTTFTRQNFTNNHVGPEMVSIDQIKGGKWVQVAAPGSK